MERRDHLQNHDNMTTNVSSGSEIKVEEVQVLIICALEIEMNALLAVLDNYERTTTSHGINLFIGKFDKVNVAVMRLTDKGQVSASKDTAQIMSELKLNAYVISAGICGATGRNSKGQLEVYLGDVVISRNICRYSTHFVKDRPFLTISSSETGWAHPRLKQQLNALEVADHSSKLCEKAYNHLQTLEAQVNNQQFASWSSTPATKPPDDVDRLYKEDGSHTQHELISVLSNSHGKGEKPVQPESLSCEATECTKESGCLERSPPLKTRRFKLHIGHYGSEDSVVRSSTPYIRGLLRENGIIAVDMEARGISQAVISESTPAVVIIKGVSDYADSQKNDAWHGYAAATAACTTKAFVVEYCSKA